jgi:thiamine pyrophosphate-dependent acetolactate synthase large subunit-like protein
MQLGALGTIAARDQKNLVMIVWDNGAYQITGGQPTTTSNVVDLVALARGSGLEKSYWAKDEADFDALVDRSLTEDGPFFIAAKIDNAKPAKTTHRDPVQIRERFMRGLGVRTDPAATV